MSEFPAPPPPETGPVFREEGPSGPRAGFWPRFGAAFVDGILLAIVGFVLRAVLGQAGAGVIDLAVGITYFGYLEGSASGQTIGKRMLGIRVIGYNDGGPIGFGRAVIRYFGRIVSAIPCFLGYFWMLWDRERQCWHDKFANDVVVPVAAYPVAHWPN
jgi:uncharacterized RDD family membrane protein YckC